MLKIPRDLHTATWLEKREHEVTKMNQQRIANIAEGSLDGRQLLASGAKIAGSGTEGFETRVLWSSAGHD